MVNEAAHFAEADKAKRETIDILNQSETAIYSVRKSLDELGEKVSNEERMKVEAAISDLEAARASNDAAQIKSRMDALFKSMEPISKKIYGQQGAGCGPDCGSEGPNEKNDGDFVDADYKIVDDE
jgi:molecular chaperone DnaK